MTYEAWPDTATPTLLDKFVLDEETRPHVGDLLDIINDPITYKIHRTEPTDNPSGQTVKYFVSPHREWRGGRAKWESGGTLPPAWSGLGCEVGFLGPRFGSGYCRS